MGNTDLVERDDCNSIINLRYGVKNMTVNCWSNNYEFVFRRENFEGVYRSELVICNFFSCHVCNSVLAKLTSGFVVFDAISIIRRLRRAGRTFVDNITRLYLRDNSF